MEHWWTALTEGQGTVISGALTVSAAVIGVILGGRIFSGKVRDIETALSATENVINAHLQRISQRLSELDPRFTNVDDKLRALEEQFSATSESLGQLRGSVGDLQSSTSQPQEMEEESGIELNREQIRVDWNAIRDLLEQKAAAPEIDGRTRAKYARIDRRSYNDLIDALEWDENLDSASRFREASEIWQKYRNGKKSINQIDASRLHDLRADLGA